MKRAALVAMLLVLPLFSGCGYTSRSAIADKYSTIHVSAFVNKVDISSEQSANNKYKIYKPALETDITRAVVSKFLFDGNLKPQKSGDADLELKGELIEFRRDPLRYTDADDVEEYRINIVVALKLYNRQGELIWEEPSFTGDTTYFTRGAAAKSEAKAVSDAVADLARRVVERTVEEW